MSRCTTLDHFLLSGTMFCESVVSNYVTHDVENTSDHESLLLQLLLEVKLLGTRKRVHKPHASWTRASESDLCKYRSELGQRLHLIKLPTDALVCGNLACKDIEHFHSINELARGITGACITAADESIPHTCARGTSGHIPGWSERIQPFREKSLF